MSTSATSSADLTVDPEIRRLTAKQVARDVSKFKRMLNERSKESKLQEFLAAHSYFFSGMIDTFNPSPLYSKVKLGHDYEVDFAWLYYDSFGPEWRLVEIENAGSALFTKSGNASATLTHAIQQARDWCEWIHNHLEYAQKLMPRISYPLCYIFLGRRHELTPENLQKLKRFRYDHRKELEIHTFDWFVRSAEAFGARIGPEGPVWYLPMKALNHRNLKQGVPKQVQEWLIDKPSPTMANWRVGRRDLRYFYKDDPRVSIDPEY